MMIFKKQKNGTSIDFTWEKEKVATNLGGFVWQFNFKGKELANYPKQCDGERVGIGSSYLILDTAQVLFFNGEEWKEG